MKVIDFKSIFIFHRYRNLLVAGENQWLGPHVVPIMTIDIIHSQLVTSTYHIMDRH